MLFQLHSQTGPLCTWLYAAPSELRSTVFRAHDRPCGVALQVPASVSELSGLPRPAMTSLAGTEPNGQRQRLGA